MKSIMNAINNKFRRKMVKVLIYSSVLIIFSVLFASWLQVDVTEMTGMYAAFMGMVSAVVISHFATKSEEYKNDTEE